LWEWAVTHPGYGKATGFPRVPTSRAERPLVINWKKGTEELVVEVLRFLVRGGGRAYSR